MLRSLWIIISTLCVANVIALAILFGWLGATNRLSPERLEDARTIFVQTVAQEQADEKQAAQRQAAAQAAAAEQAEVGTPPITAEQRMAIIQEYSELVNQRTARARRETQDMINTLMKDQARFLEERKAFEKERDDFQKMREKIAALEGSDQFQKALTIYESVKPDVAAAMLGTLIEQGEVEQVVSYLNAMKPRNASKVVASFESQDPKLAADLLERLRTHGLVAQASEDGP